MTSGYRKIIRYIKDSVVKKAAHNVLSFGVSLVPSRCRC